MPCDRELQKSNIRSRNLVLKNSVPVVEKRSLCADIQHIQELFKNAIVRLTLDQRFQRAPRA